MTVRSLLTALAVASTLALAACGNDEESGETAEESTTPQQAIGEIGTVRANLDTALRQLESGDYPAAEETLAESYTEHFEKVEGPLGNVDHELNEEIEETLATKLRGRVKYGAPAGDVEALIGAVKRDLETAEAKLAR